MISGYKSVREHIYANDEKNDDLTYNYNTGIIVADMVDAATDIITANPIGCAIT